MSQTPEKKKRSNTLGKLFKRGKQGEAQPIVVQVNDKAVGEIPVDISVSLSKMRKALAGSKLALPGRFAFVINNDLIKPEQEDNTKVCDSVFAQSDNIVIQVKSLDPDDNASNDNAAKASEGAAAAGSPRTGRGMLKRTKPKGGDMQEAITLLTHVEAEAMVVATLLDACGGADAVSAVGLKQIANKATQLVNDNADAFVDANAGGSQPLYKASSFVEAANQAAVSLKAELTPGPAANDGKYHSVAYDDQGSRKYMEDKWTIAPHLGAMFGIDESEPTYFYGVYDGHTGKLAAEYVKTHLHANIARHPLFLTDLRQAVTEAYLQTDIAFNEHAKRQGLKDGTTVVTVVMRGKKMYTHWCGDSEGLLCHRSRSLKLVDPHTPARADEKSRINEAGGTVVWFGTWRVNGTLGVARSIGDADHAGVVIATPDSIERDITADDTFIMLATDGLFDVFKHEEATMSTVHWINTPDRDPDAICNALVGEALRRKTKDNVTCMFVFFKENPLPKLRPVRTAHPKVPTKACPVPPRDAYEAAQKAAGMA